MRRVLCLVLSLLLTSWMAGPLYASASEAENKAINSHKDSSQEDVFKLLHLLEKAQKDPALIASLLGQKTKASQETAPPEDLSETSDASNHALPQVTDVINRFSSQLFLFVKEVETQVVKYATSLKDPDVRQAVLSAIGVILGVVFAGLVGEALFYLLIHPFEKKLVRRVEEGHLTKREIFWIK